MFVYRQATGEIYAGDGTLLGKGYAGADHGKNRPDFQHSPNVGPIPQGRYHVGAPQDTETHGPFVLSLTPWDENQMYGRSGFLIHGDSKTAPGTASQGCIVLDRAIREKIAANGDMTLMVVA